MGFIEGAKYAFNSLARPEESISSQAKYCEQVLRSHWKDVSVKKVIGAKDKEIVDFRVPKTEIGSRRLSSHILEIKDSNGALLARMHFGKWKDKAKRPTRPSSLMLPVVQLLSDDQRTREELKTVLSKLTAKGKGIYPRIRVFDQNWMERNL
ncbi:MAG: hypothetical protein ABIG96_01395 [Candidatus Micrarchaeota archaeon]